MAWEGSVDPAEEPVDPGTDAEAADDAAGQGEEPQCSGSEDGNADEQTDDADSQSDQEDQDDQSDTQKTIPRRRLPLLGRVPARYFPFWAAEFAAALTKGLTPIQMNVLGTFLSVIADGVSAIAAKAEVEEDEEII